MAKRGPKGPRLDIDIEQFEKLCAIHCAEFEIAEWFNMSIDTLERRVKEHYGENFADVFKRKRGRGKISLRRIRWKLAMEGNVTMIIWLSKQHLGESDKQSSEIAIGRINVGDGVYKE